ncbi:hypothetical protein LXL04_038971 [Taraxacum kok-saghyz]
MTWLLLNVVCLFKIKKFKFIVIFGTLQNPVDLYGLYQVLVPKIRRPVDLSVLSVLVPKIRRAVDLMVSDLPVRRLLDRRFVFFLHLLIFFRLFFFIPQILYVLILVVPHKATVSSQYAHLHNSTHEEKHVDSHLPELQN